MALTVAELRTVLSADTKDLESGLKRAQGDVDGFSSKFKSGVGTMTRWGAAAAAAGATAAVAFGVKAAMAASDLEESISKVNTVFDANAGAIQAWSKQTAGSIGLSRNEALAAAGSFGNMFDQLGIGSKQSAKMSTSMVELAADFASFHNADITEVLNAQQAAFRGEFDSLQRFLPLINAATVEQKAMAMTGKTNVKALTQQEKALAVNALMMEGAGEAQGDFARTSGGLANQIRILKAQSTDFAANVGRVLIPVVLKGLELFKSLAGTLQTLLAPAISAVSGFAREVANVFKLWQSGGIDLAGAIAGLISEDLRFLPVIQRIVDAVKGAIGWFKNFGESFRSAGDDTSSTAGKITAIIGQLKDMFSSAFGAIQAIVVTAVDFVSGVWRVFGDDIMSFTREYVASILETFRGIVNALTGVFDLIKAVLTGKWGAAWAAVKKIVDGAWDTIFGVVRHAVTNVIPTIFAGLGQILASVFRTAFNGLADIITAPFRGAFNSIKSLWNSTLGGFGFEFGGWDPPGPGPTIPGFGFKIPKMHQGGVVPGPRGADVPIMAQAGERVIPAGGGGGGGSDRPMIIQLVADGRVIQEILLAHQRRTGDLGFRVLKENVG